MVHTAFGFDGSVRIKADLNHSNFDQGLSVMTGKVQSFGKMLNKLVSVIGIAFGTAALVNFGKEAVKAASALNDAWMGLESIVAGQGKSFSKAKSFINDYISDGLVPLENAVTAYKNLAARGYDTEQIEKTLTALKDAAAFGRQSSYSLGDAVSSATEGLKNENSILVDNAGVTKNVAKMWDDYARSIGTTANNLTQEQKIQAEVNGILEETRFQTGDAAKLVNTYSGQIAMLSYNFQQFKVAVGNALIPIAQAVLPGINAIISALTKLANVFAKVTAMLFGKSTQVKTNTGVESSAIGAADATDKLTESTEEAGEASKQAAKDMKGVQAGFDELNILAGKAASSMDDASGSLDLSGTDVELPEVDTEGEIFSDVTISPKLMEDIEALRDALERIWDVFKQSWEINGPEVTEAAKRALESIYELLKAIGRAFTEAWTGGAGLEFLNAVWEFLTMILNLVADIADALKTAFDNVGEEFFESFLFVFTEILKLITSIGEAFREAWNDGSGVEICETILRIFTDINNIIGTVAMKIREAWEANGNGVAIWNAVLDIVQTVLSFIERLTSSTLEWANGLNFEPLISAFRGLLEVIDPLVEVITDGLAYAYENVLLPFGKWVVEELAPAGIELVTGAIEGLTAVLEDLEPMAEWLWENFLQPIAEWTGGVIVDVLKAIADGLSDIAAVINGELSLTDFIAQLTPLQTILLGIASAFVAVKTATTGIALAKTIQEIVTHIMNLDMLDAPGIIGKLAQVFTIAGSSAYTFSDAVQMVFGPGSIIAGIAMIIGGAVTAISNFIAMLKNGFSWAQEALMLLGIAITAIGAIILGAPAAIAGVVAAIVAVVANLVIAVSGHWDEIKQAFIDAWNAIQEAWSAACEWFDEHVIQPIAEFFSDLWETITEAASNAWDNIQTVWDAVSGWFDENVIQPVVGFFTDLWENVTQLASDAWDGIVAIWESVSNWFNENIIEPLKTFFSEMWDNIKQWASDTWDGIVSVWEAVSGWFNEKIITPVSKFFSDMWEKIRTGASDLWDKIKGVWQSASNWFEEHVTKPIGDAFQAVGDFIKGVFNGVIGTIEWLINSVIKGINWLIEKLNSISFEIPEGVPFVGGTKFGINIPTVSEVKLPRLANGAVIPPNQQFAAILGDQRSGVNIEAPLSTIERALENVLSRNGGIGGSTDVNVNFTGSLSELARILQPAITVETRRQGFRMTEVKV